MPTESTFFLAGLFGFAGFPGLSVPRRLLLGFGVAPRFGIA